MNDLGTYAENTWCPGCGNFGILNAFKKAVLKLEEKGIATVPGALAVHTVEYYKNKYRLRECEFPTSLMAYKLSITLPLYPQMNEKEQNYVINSIKNLN